MSEYIKIFGYLTNALSTMPSWRFITIVAVILYCFSIWVLPDVFSVPVTIDN